MKNRLISMTDFVLELAESKQVKITKFINYANFLKQPLTLGMFVPCDLDGNVLEEPEHYDDWYKWGDFSKYGNSITKKCSDFHKSKERCLFEGFELENIGEFTTWIQKGNHSICFTDRGKININSHNEKTVEDIIKYNLELTPTALRQLGL